MGPQGVSVEGGPAMDELVDALSDIREHIRALDHDTEATRQLAEARAVVTTCDFLQDRLADKAILVQARDVAVGIMVDVLEEFTDYHGGKP